MTRAQISRAIMRLRNLEKFSKRCREVALTGDAEGTEPLPQVLDALDEVIRIGRAALMQAQRLT